MTYEVLLGARVERGPAALHVPAPVIDATADEGRVRMVADRERAFLRVDGVAQFAISEGQRVRVEPSPGASPTDVERYLQGTVAAVLLGQRGNFALHASLARVADTVIAVAASQGVGKSTTALRLEQLGHELLGDDFAELRPEADGVAYTTVSRAVYVAPETATALGVNATLARRPTRPGEKLALPAPPVSSGRVGAIAVLAISSGGDVATQRLTGGQALANVFRHAVRANVAKVLWPSEAFAWAAAVTARLPVYAVTRPFQGWTVDAVADAIEAIAAETRSSHTSRL